MLHAGCATGCQACDPACSHAHGATSPVHYIPMRHSTTAMTSVRSVYGIPGVTVALIITRQLKAVPPLHNRFTGAMSHMAARQRAPSASAASSPASTWSPSATPPPRWSTEFFAGGRSEQRASLPPEWPSGAAEAAAAAAAAGGLHAAWMASKPAGKT